MGIKRVTKRYIVIVSLLALLVTSTAFAVDGYSNFSKVREYSANTFTDVPEDMWYADQVVFGYEMGLLSGKGDRIFDPMGDVTLAETMTLASIVHAKFYDIDIQEVNGRNWYDIYVEYCYLMDIADRPIFEDRNLNTPATREEVAGIFGRILPSYDETLPYASPPDVIGLPRGRYTEEGEWIGEAPKVGESLFYEEIIALYRAGILVGSDSKGTFYPRHDITRAEVVTIMNNIVDPIRRRAYADTANGERGYTFIKMDLDRLYVNNEVSGITPVLWYNGEEIDFDVEPIYQGALRLGEDIVRNLYPFEEVMEGIGASNWQVQNGFQRFYWKGTVFEIREHDWYGGTAIGIIDATTQNWIVNQLLEIEGVLMSMDSDVVRVLEASGASVELDTMSGTLFVLKNSYALSMVEKYERLREAYDHLSTDFYLERKRSEMTDKQYAEVQAVVEEIVNGKSTTRAKARAINTWIADNLDYKEPDRGAGDPIQGSAYKAFDRGYAVCAGYSTLTATMLRMAGIPSRVVISTEANHAWVEYYDKGKWHIIDSTGYDDGVIVNGIYMNDEHYFDMPMSDVLGVPSNIDVSF